MVALSRLTDFHVISWRQRMEDPIAEWGQLLAYLPAIRRHIGERDSRVILLPVPTLANDRNVHRPHEFIGRIATSRGQSVQQVRRYATAPWPERPSIEIAPAAARARPPASIWSVNPPA